MATFDFTDQRIIITGGTRGIGRKVGEAFLKSGGTVIATYAANDAAAQEFKGQNQAYLESGHLEVRKFDVSHLDDVKAFFQFLEDKYPSLEVLVNNSGIRKDALLPLMKEEDWNRVMDVNLNGSFYMTKYGVKSFLKNRYGRIIHISSIGGLIGLQGQANYSASKAAQIGMAKSLSREVGRKNITVNCVCPGFVETELIGDLSSAQVEEYKKQIPLRRFGRGEEVAHGVLFLASREASYINGIALEITGGL